MMEATREIYWNVGHGVIAPMYLVALCALALCAWGFWRRLPVYRLGKPLSRLDQLPRRMSLLVRKMLTQSQVLRVVDPGSLHAIFFWGFGLLFIGTLLIMAQADLSQPIFDVVFL